MLEFDPRPGLIDPTVDPFGYSWSVPRDAPSALAAFAPGSEQIPIAGAWPEVTQVTAMSLSRDGTRLAAVVVAGGRTAVWVSGVVRDVEGVPSALGEPSRVLANLPAAGIALAWLDDTTVAVLTGSGAELRGRRAPGRRAHRRPRTLLRIRPRWPALRVRCA